MINMMWQGLLETSFMVIVSACAGACVGGPLALFMWMISPKGLRPHAGWSRTLGYIINGLRSIPYIIFMVLLLPVTRMVVGSAIGTVAATFPLTLAAILLFTRMAEESFRALPQGLVDAGKVMGATSSQILFKIILKEALPSLVAALTNLSVLLIGFSAMAGAVGGGGLGDLAIRYGYQRYDVPFLMSIVVVLMLMVQCVQWSGDKMVQKLRK